MATQNGSRTRLYLQSPHRRSQMNLVLAMLRQAREDARTVNIYEFMDAHVATYCARIRDLRLRGFVILNVLAYCGDGAPRSSYRLIHDPEVDGADHCGPARRSAKRRRAMSETSSSRGTVRAEGGAGQ
jgi:hypothetical protein